MMHIGSVIGKMMVVWKHVEMLAGFQIIGMVPVMAQRLIAMSILQPSLGKNISNVRHLMQLGVIKKKRELSVLMKTLRTNPSLHAIGIMKVAKN